MNFRRFKHLALIGFALVIARPVMGQTNQPPNGQRPAPAQVIQRFDRNGDGKLSRDEAPDRLKQRWDEIDTDHDGFITLAELTAWDPRMGRGMLRENLPNHFQPDVDFSVVILGSGAPQYDPKRAGPSAAIQYHGRFILVDMGNGTQAQLYKAGIALSQIDAFFITHHHLDHDEEFMPLVDKALVRGEPLEIVGTPGTKKLTDFTEDFYSEDIAYRKERRGRTGQTNRKPTIREIQGGESFKLGALQVTSAQVPHSIHTVAYRFDVGGQSIVISGDLTYSDKLIELARGADVLVMDSGGSIVRPGATRPIRGAAASGGGSQPSAHASAQEATGWPASRARCGRGSTASQNGLTIARPGRTQISV